MDSFSFTLHPDPAPDGFVTVPYAVADGRLFFGPEVIPGRTQEGLVPIDLWRNYLDALEVGDNIRRDVSTLEIAEHLGVSLV